MLRLHFDRTQRINRTRTDLPDFRYIPEENNEFLALFPHRNDYLWADYPAPGKRPEWHTQSRHPLSDRQIQQADRLLGVRFGSLTHYIMLDIDPDSVYHPRRDAFAITNILAALEPLGLVDGVAISSSSREGIHLYLPFQEAQKSWAIARATAILLTNQGFTLLPGQLELFPNPKPYNDTPTLFNGHRLPLQPGSYLLNSEWQPTYSTEAAFVRQWKFAQNRNEVCSTTIEQILKAAQQKTYSRLRSGGQKYLNDLNAEIEPGWTAVGQTNFLLGKIANRERVFHHVLWGGDPLEGEELARTIAQVARSLPGFQTFCGHQAELDQKAREWARSAEQRYYPYTHGCVPSQQQEETPELSWNQKQAQAARDRITGAIADLLNCNALPSQPTARRHAIRSYGIGNKTLDKNRDLWHPDYLQPSPEAKYHPGVTDLDNFDRLEPIPGQEYHSTTSNKLEGFPVSDASQKQSETNPSLTEGGNGGDSTGESASKSIDGSIDESTNKSPQGIEWIKFVLAQIQLRKKQTTLTYPNLLETNTQTEVTLSPNSLPVCSPLKESFSIDTPTIATSEQIDEV